METRDLIVLVTGATSGIGWETSRQLAAMGCTVILHGKDQQKLNERARQLRGQKGYGTIDTVAADFASLASVRRMGEMVVRNHSRLNVLVNNAGVYMLSREVTGDGIEMTFGVNHIAHVLLTHLLLDRLKENAPSRIIMVSSVAHSRATVDMNNLQAERSFDGYRAYALSKLANVLFTYDLARRLANTGVTANCLHPGVINTKLLRSGFPSIDGDSLENGATTTVYLATAPEVETVTGAYFVARKQQSSSPLSNDIGLQESFRTISERLAGIS